MPGFLDNTMTVSRGSVYSKAYESDGLIHVSGAEFLLSSQNTNSWVITRVAAQEPSARLTANGTGAFQWTINLGQLFLQKFGTDPILSAMPFPAGTTNFPGVVKLGTETTATDADSHIIRGYQVTSIALAYSITVANMTSQTLTGARNVFANNVAIAQTTPNGAWTASPTLATATQANPYVTTITPANVIIAANNANLTQDILECSIVPVTTGVYDLWGAWIFFNYCIL